MAAMDSFLTLLGLARRAGKLAIGEEPVRQALDSGSAKTVFLAADAADHTRRKVEPRLGNASLRQIPATKAQLGRALGRESCAVCAVTESGFAKSLADRLKDEPVNTNHDGGVVI